MTPDDFLAAHSGLGNLWRLVDVMRADPRLNKWPPYVFLPYAGWYALACRSLHKERLDTSDMAHMQSLAICGTWRITQDVVRFDPDLYAALTDTPLDGDIPCDVLRRLPAWCIYLETPGMVMTGHAIHGFWAMLEKDANNGVEELRLYFLFDGDHDDGDIASAFFPIIMELGDFSAQEALERVMATDVLEGRMTQETFQFWRGHTAEFARVLAPSINLLLYLCACGFPGAEGGSGGAIHRPRAKKVKGGWRLFPAQRVTIRHMGQEVGDAIRQARAAGRSTGSHASPRPHVRRAHWHGYWHGPKKGQDGAAIPQKYKLTWLPPIAVAMGEGGEDE